MSLLRKNNETKNVPLVDIDGWLADGWVPVEQPEPSRKTHAPIVEPNVHMLFRDGVKRRVPEIDLAACLADGWSYDAAIAPVVEAIQPIPVSDEQPHLFYLVNEVSELQPLIDVPGIGEATATGLIRNRPDGGYQSWRQLIDLNTALRRVNWEELADWQYSDD